VCNFLKTNKKLFDHRLVPVLQLILHIYENKCTT
jgi:hypothetical protein